MSTANNPSQTCTIFTFIQIWEYFPDFWDNVDCWYLYQVTAETLLYCSIEKLLNEVTYRQTDRLL